MSPVPLQLKGSSTTIAGIIAIIMGALGIVHNVIVATHGGSLDSTTLTGSIGSVISGVGLVKSADAKQQ